ncbi:putative alcohol oxidase [Hypoxylon sp. CI-4A]|nr:putative alcohol oxidase [Hypoxylon sp. CI-4A]
MGLYTKLPDGIEEVDVIIVGGGATGCIVASRLSDADPGLHILIIESGINNYEDPMVLHPSYFGKHIAPGAKYTRTYQGPKSDYLAGRQASLPTGHILGGGSSINLAVYSRAQRSDYEAWQTPGWSADDMLFYMNKFETYHGPDPEGRHGHDGPIHISPSRFRSQRLMDNFLTALNKVGWPEVEDLNKMGSTNGAMRTMSYIDLNGRRQDAAHKYLHPRLQDGKHPNLHVLVESQVERVLFEDKRAVGLVYRPNPDYQPSNGSYRTIQARRMVCLSAGPLETPLLLERSGIGASKVLNRAGIPVVADLPGVGHDYEDHHLAMYTYKSSLTPEETLDAFNAYRLDHSELIAKNDPIMSWNGVDVQAKFRPTDTDVTSLGPEFQEAWAKEFKNTPDKPLMVMSPVGCFLGDPTTVSGQFFTLVGWSLYPFSRGHIHITGPSLNDPIDFDPGVLSDSQDLDVKSHVWMYKKQLEVARRMAVFEGVGFDLPPFASDSKARSIESTSSITGVEDIEYTTDDDRVLEQWIRSQVNSTWHPIGTCKMAPREEMGVVDPRLSVYGVQGLKVADMSIPPGNIGANLCNTAFAIAEKAADIFIEELGLGKQNK